MRLRRHIDLPAGDAFAAAHGRIDFGDWRQTIEGATRFVVGLAGVYLLDPLALGYLGPHLPNTKTS